MFVLNKKLDGYQNDNVSPIKVSTTTGESIRALVSRLLAKRGLRLTSFDVFSSKVITDHGHGHNHVDVDVDVVGDGDGDGDGWIPKQCSG